MDASYSVSAGGLRYQQPVPTAGRNKLKVFRVDLGGTVRGLVVCGPQADEFIRQVSPARSRREMRMRATLDRS